MKRRIRTGLLRYQNETVNGDFTLQEIYQFSEHRLSAAHPNNDHVQGKIRQVLQQLRDQGEIELVDGQENYSTDIDETVEYQTAE